MKQTKPRNTRFYKRVFCFVIIETILYLIYTLPWALAFDSYVSTTNPKKCQKSMLWWTNFTNYYFWWTSIWNIISIPLRYNSYQRYVRNIPRMKFDNFIECTKAIQIIGGVFCLIMLMKVYEYRDECKYLAPLVKLFLISSLITLMIWCTGTYLIYVRLWNKILEWIKNKEIQQDKSAILAYKRQIKSNENDYATKILIKNEDDETPLVYKEICENINNNNNNKVNYELIKPFLDRSMRR